MSSEIVAQMQRYVDALTSLDADAAISFYADDPGFLVYFDGQAFSREALITAVGCPIIGTRHRPST